MGKFWCVGLNITVIFRITRNSSSSSRRRRRSHSVGCSHRNGNIPILFARHLLIEILTTTTTTTTTAAIHAHLTEIIVIAHLVSSCSTGNDRIDASESMVMMILLLSCFDHSFVDDSTEFGWTRWCSDAHVTRGGQVVAAVAHERLVRAAHHVGVLFARRHVVHVRLLVDGGHHVLVGRRRAYVSRLCWLRHAPRTRARAVYVHGRRDLIEIVRRHLIRRFSAIYKTTIIIKL